MELTKVKRKVYMDYNATTPVDRSVVTAMCEAMVGTPGNASSLHLWGDRARDQLEAARSRVAAAIGAEPEEIIFTSGGTEADNMAIFGVFDPEPHAPLGFMVSPIEHSAVLNFLEKWLHLDKFNMGVSYLAVDDSGSVDPAEVKKRLTNETKLVSIMDSNNETGRIQPIREIAQITREAGVLLHTDAVQSLGKIPINVKELGVDLMSLSAHKIYGPKGVGALYVRKGVKISGMMAGGHQESDLRPGTENIPAIVGFGRACTIAADNLLATFDRMLHLRDRLLKGICAMHGLSVYTDLKTGHSLPNTLSLGFSGVDGDALVFSLNISGVYASTGAACTAGTPEPSHVLIAQGLTHQTANTAIRLSLGKQTKDADVDYVSHCLRELVPRLRVSGKTELEEIDF